MGKVVEYYLELQELNDEINYCNWMAGSGRNKVYWKNEANKAKERMEELLK